MAKYLAAAVEPPGSPLSAAWKLVQTPAADGPSPSLRMGLAWHVATSDGRNVVWHNGQTGGFATWWRSIPWRARGLS